MIRRIFVGGLGLFIAAGTALAQGKKPLTATEMRALLKNGLAVTTMDLQGGKEFTGRVNLAANGTISGTLTPVGHSAIALSGTWKLQGAQLCRTLNPIQAELKCETWLRSGPREVIVQVDGKEVSMNRW